MSREPNHVETPIDLEQEMAACRQALGRIDELERLPLPAELEQLRTDVDAVVARDTGWLGKLRGLRRGSRAALMALVVGLLTVIVVWLTPRADLGQYPAAQMGVAVGLLAMLTMGASWRLLRPLHLPAPRRHRTALLVGAAVAAPFVLALWPLGYVGAPAGEGSAFVVACAKCLAFGGALGFPVGVFSHVMRRDHVGGAAVAGLGGVVAGLVGNLCLQVHCSITDPAHLLVGHAPLLVLFGALAAWVGRASASRLA